MGHYQSGEGTSGRKHLGTEGGACRERFALTDAEVLALDGPALQRIAPRLTARWHPSMGALIARYAVTETIALASHTAVPLPPWPPTAVTLRDASLLCRHLVASAQRETPVLAAIGATEGKMVADGSDAVRTSQQAPGRHFSPAVPGWLAHELSGLAHRLRSARQPLWASHSRRNERIHKQPAEIAGNHHAAAIEPIHSTNIPANRML
jgi:hypothetical protein